MAALFPLPDKVYEQADIVKKTDDEQILFDIVKNHPFSEVREIAIKRIDNDDVLNYVAKNDSEEFIRIEAKKRLKQLGYM